MSHLSHRIFLIASICLLLPSFQAAGEPNCPTGDLVLFATPTTFRVEKLANTGTPAVASGTLSREINALTYLDDGRLIGVAETFPVGTDLVEIAADGQVSLLRESDYIYIVRDLATDSYGRLFALAWSYWWNPPTFDPVLLELDPNTGLLIRAIDVDPYIDSIARAADGELWAHGILGLRKLNPVTGQLSDRVLRFSEFPVVAIASDSSGAVWGSRFVTCFITHQCSTLDRFDPATGEVTSAAKELDYLLADFAILRQSPSTVSNDTLCLQNNRFQVTVAWQDPTGGSGAGIVTPAHGQDTGLFYFFDPNNWELMVKVLDGCAINGHYWVFSAAGTNVGYTLTVKDLDRDLQKDYTNPLGTLAAPVADTMAFACP